MASDLSIVTQRWVQKALQRFGLDWGLDSTRPWSELAARGALSGAHLGLGRILRLGNLQRELRHRGEMQWALWRLPLPRHSQTPRRGRVLWIPGWGDTPFSWLGVATAVAMRKGFEELVILDFPGFHGSLAHSRCITEMDRIFEISCDIGKELRPEIVVGHSLGGWLAARIAMDLESTVQKLILMAPSGICGGQEDRERWREEFESFVKAENADDYGSRLFAKTPPGWGKLGSLFIPFLSREDTRAFLQSIEQRHFLDEGFSEKLNSLANIEIALLWGELDQVVPARFAHSWMKALPRTQLTTWTDIGHMPQIEAPVRLVRWLNQHLLG